MMEYALDEEIPEEFKGGTLQINEDKHLNSEALNKTGREKVHEVVNNVDNVNNNTNTWKDSIISPFTQLSGSIWNKKEVNSQERLNAVVQPSVVNLVRENANNFFTFRADIVNKAINECIEQFLDFESDGPLLHTFLLTEINLWDTEKERLILLSTNTLINIKYDFIALKTLEYKKIPLGHVDSVMIGYLVYPNASLIPNRNMRGIRIMWNKGQPLNFTKKWNPFSSDVPLCTFTSHPLYYHKGCTNEGQRKLYDIEEFIDKLCEATSNLERNGNNKCSCIIHHKDIILENYVGIGSLVHNRNALGFFKVRGKFSF